MSPIAIAGVWLALGLVASALLRRRTARLVALVPLVGAGVTLLVTRSTANAVPLGGLIGITGLDRTAEGILVAAGVSMTLVLLLQPTVDVTVGRAVGVVGAAATIAMASSDPLLTALALTVAVATLVLRWIGQVPGKATLAAGRVAGGGTAALVVASPFLPLTGFTTGARPIVVGVLLAIGVAALLAVYPLGGWATGVIGELKPADVAPWLVLLVPVVLILAERIPGGNLGAGAPVFEHLLLVVGLGSAVWGGVWAVWGRRSMRYGRVFMADIALCVAAVEGAHASPALTGALIILVTHLTLAPILLRSEKARLALAPPGGLGAAQRRAAVTGFLGSPAHPGGACRGERRLDHRSRDRNGGHLHRRGHGVRLGSSDRSGPGLEGPPPRAWGLVARRRRRRSGPGPAVTHRLRVRALTRWTHSDCSSRSSPSPSTPEASFWPGSR